MPSHVLQVAMSFGGSMYYENRSGIGRFGVGMKTAALSMSPVLEVYSWQEANAFYSMTLDVEDIGNSRSNLVLLPEPQLLDTLPSEVSRIFTRPMSFPKDSSRQELIADDEDNLCERLGTSGTIVFIPDCDRLTAKRPQTLVEHATRDMARVYRKAIGSGLRLYINNRIVELFDPTYWMPNARHTQISELTETRSRLINTWPDIPIPIEDGSDVTAPVSVRLYMLPIEAWYGLPRKVQKNDLQIFEDHLVSFVRNGREVHIGTVKELSGGRHGDSAWLRIQVDFNGELDEAFGVAMNKQGVRPKKYALEAIRKIIKDDVSRVREQTASYRAAHARKASQSGLTEAERRANEADAFQGKPIPQPSPTTDEEREALEHNLRVFASGLKREEETDEQAYQRVKNSTYITAFKHDDYWPFYHVESKYGKIVLTINSAHPFFSKLYEPLASLVSQSSIDGEDVIDGADATAQTSGSGRLVVALQMLLLSLARAQSQMLVGEESDKHQLLFDTLGREWSGNLKTQLQMLQTGP